MAVHMFRTMLMAADSQSVVLGDRIPWDQYDRFVVIHAGSDLQTDVLQDSPEDIPTFTLGVADTDVVWMRDIPAPGDSVRDRSRHVRARDREPGRLLLDAQRRAGARVRAPVLRLRDLYNIESGLPVVGCWSLMDSGNQVGRDRADAALGRDVRHRAAAAEHRSVPAPVHRRCADPAARWCYGDTVTIQNSERHPDVRRVTLSSDEYLLIENRYLAPAASVQLDQDSTTHVILGPKTPDALRVRRAAAGRRDAGVAHRRERDSVRVLVPARHLAARQSRLRHQHESGAARASR